MSNRYYKLDLSKYPDERVKAYYKKMYRRYGGMVWVTNDKRIIPMKYMSHNHLMAAYISFIRVLANFAQQKDYRSFEKHEHRYWILREETTRRGIPIPPHEAIEKCSNRIESAKDIELSGDDYGMVF